MTLLTACVWARYLIVWANISKTGGMSALFCCGVAHAAPVYAAFLIALAPWSLGRRLILGIAWLGIVMAAMTIGNIDKAKIGTVMMFSQELIYGLPVITLGWLIPFGYLRWFKGWRLELPGTERQVGREKITISTLFLLTFLVSLCFFSLQFASQRYIMFALGGMLATAVLGLILAIAVWLVMRKSLVVLSFVFVAGIACYFLLDYVLFRFGAGTIVTPIAVFFSGMLLASLMGFIVMRVSGARLLTGVPEIFGSQHGAREGGSVEL